MFHGFSDAAIDFMWGIRFNNERSWYEAHKEAFRTHVQTPMRDLAREVYDFMEDAFPEQGFTVKVSRIHRDARRLHGRGPYRDSLWFSIDKPHEDWMSAPSFFFELTPEGGIWGLGYWAKPMTMAKFRARMDADPRPMEDLTTLLHTRPDFALQAPEYKRPKGSPASELLRPWYQKKYISLCHEEPIPGILYSRELAGRLKEDFAFFMPFYSYLSTLDGDPEPERI